MFPERRHFHPDLERARGGAALDGCLDSQAASGQQGELMATKSKAAPPRAHSKS